MNHIHTGQHSSSTASLLHRRGCAAVWWQRTQLPGVALLLSALAGCGIFGGDEIDPNAPAELVEFESSTQLKRVWRTSVGAGAGDVPLYNAPVYNAGKVYIADRKGEIYVVAADSGRVENRIESKLRISAGPEVSGGLILVGTVDGEVFAFSSDDGEVRWRAPVSSEVLSKPILHDGVVVVRCIDGRIFGFDAITGVRRWLYDRNVPLLTLRGNSPPLARGGVIYVGYDGGEVIALRAGDGTLIWEQPVSTREGKTDLERLADIDGPMAIVASDLYVTSSKGRLAALSLQSGRIQWVKDTGSAKGLAVARTRLALADSSSQVWLVDRINSATLWKQDKLFNRDVTRPAFYLNYTVVGDSKGYLHLIDTESGEFAARDRLDSDGISRAPLVIGTDMFIYTDAGNLYLYRAGAAI